MLRRGERVGENMPCGVRAVKLEIPPPLLQQARTAPQGRQRYAGKEGRNG